MRKASKDWETFNVGPILKNARREWGNCQPMCFSKIGADPGFYWSQKKMYSYGKMFLSKTDFFTALK